MMNKLSIVSQRSLEMDNAVAMGQNLNAYSELFQSQLQKPYRIYTLGHIQIFHNGELVNDFSRSKKKPMDMLKLLIALGAREVSQEKMSALLWPDAEGDAAQQTFDTTLHRLRKLLGSAKFLLLREGRLSLNTALCWLDCWSFEKLQRQLEKNLHRTLVDYVTINKLTQEFFDLYPAHFLHNDNELPWLFGYRQSLQSKYLLF